MRKLSEEEAAIRKYKTTRNKNNVEAETLVERLEEAYAQDDNI